MLAPAFLSEDPGPIRHRWLVAHMLSMATLKIRHPIVIFVQMIAHDRLLHAQTTLLIFPSASVGLGNDRSFE